MFKTGDKVRIRIRQTWHEGIISQFADFGYETMWWVSYSIDGRNTTDLFLETKLENWNNFSKCTCGSDTLKHPGHSYFCDSLTYPDGYDD